MSQSKSKGLYLVAAGLVVALVMAAIALAQQTQTNAKIDKLTQIAEQQSALITQGAGQADIQTQIADQLEAFEKAKLLREYESVATGYQNARDKIESGDRIYGNPDAEFSVIEFSDFDCPYCKRYHDTPKKVVDGSGGDVNWVWKHFPVHASAQPLHKASECIGQIAGNKDFWAATQLIFDNDGSRGLKPADLADKMPVDRDAFAKCMASSEMQAKVDADYKFGQEAGVSGTPATFVIHHKSGEVYTLKGAVPAGQLETAIGQLRKKAAAHQTTPSSS